METREMGVGNYTRARWAIFGAVAVVVAALVAIVVIALFGKEGSDSLVVTILGFAGPTVVGLLALAGVHETGAKVDDLHKTVNGRMEAMVESVKRSAEQEGYLRGLSDGRQEGQVGRNGKVEGANGGNGAV